MRSGQSVICDNTVSGTGSFMYAAPEAGTDFDAVFDAFLESNRLLVIKGEGLWTVTRIKVETDGEGKISVDSLDSTAAMVFEKISEKTGKPVVWETLPSQRLSLHIKERSAEETVRLIMQPYSEYTVTAADGAIQIARKKDSNAGRNTAAAGDAACTVSYTGGKYDVQVRNTGVSEVLSKIFSYCGESYSDFLTGDETVKSVSFTGKSLEQTLMLVLEQVNAEPLHAGDIWYMFPKASRTSGEAVTARERCWHTLSVKNMSVSKLVPLVTAGHPGISVTELSLSHLAVCSTEEEWEEIKEYTQALDESLENTAVHLKYIKTTDLLQVLPPFVTKEEIADTGTGNSFFYTGSAEKRERFLEQLKEIDVPKKLVRYDLLILQYEKSSSLSWGISTSVRPSTIGDRMLLSGEIGNLLNINFDAITAFGLTFSQKINTAIQENKAAVFADTTLYGLSGEKISFKNTNTYRYKDAAVDPSSGKESFSTVTREITSGLVLEIDGWVSGDGVITMQIGTSVSKQGVDVSKKNGNPPPTSEKNITTKIRARSGEPVVLSGLSQSDYSDSSQGVPFISKIPVLGNLFKSKDKSETKTEMTIYLLPHIEGDTDEEGGSWKERLVSFVREKEAEKE